MRVRKWRTLNRIEKLRREEDGVFSLCRVESHYQVKGTQSDCFQHDCIVHGIHADDAPAFTCCACEEQLDDAGMTRLWPKRCPQCDIKFARWKRMQVWREGLENAVYSKSSYKARFVTFTNRHDYIPCEYDDNGNLLPPADVSVASESRIILEKFRRMKRRADFKRIFDGGGVWVAECTHKIISSCDVSYANLLPAVHDAKSVARASPADGGKDSVRRVIRQTNVHSIHPHIHCILVGNFIDMKLLNKLAKASGFDNVDVKLIHGSLRSKLNYLSVYLGKEQPLPRSRDAFGLCKRHIAEARKVRKVKGKR